MPVKRLTLLLAACATLVSAQTLLFKSGFEPATTLGPVTGTAPTGPEQSISGTDAVSHFTWPITAFSPNPALDGIHIIPPHTSTDSNSLHFFNALDTTTFHSGTKSLLLDMRGYADNNCCAQNVLNMVGMSTPITSLYQRAWVKLGPEFASQLATNTNNFWRDMWEMKTSTDYRIITYVNGDVSGQPYWFAQADNNPDGSRPPSGSLVTFWSSSNTSVPVPLNQWFLMEVYLKRSTGSDGQFFWAVNGQTLVNHMGANMGVNSERVFQWMTLNEYGPFFPMKEWVDDLELWDTPPCGTLPCGSGSSAALPTISSFTSSPASIFPGASSTLSWASTGGTSCSIDHGVGTVSCNSGSTPVSPSVTTIYTFSATNSFGTTNRAATVTVTAPTIASFSASPTTVASGGLSTLSWSTSGATSCSINQGVGTVTCGSSSVGVHPTANTAYQLTATNSVGPTTATATVTVTTAPHSSCNLILQ